MEVVKGFDIAEKSSLGANLKLFFPQILGNKNCTSYSEKFLKS